MHFNRVKSAVKSAVRTAIAKQFGFSVESRDFGACHWALSVDDALEWASCYKMHDQIVIRKRGVLVAVRRPLCAESATRIKSAKEISMHINWVEINWVEINGRDVNGRDVTQGDVTQAQAQGRKDNFNFSKSWPDYAARMQAIAFFAGQELDPLTQSEEMEDLELVPMQVELDRKKLSLWSATRRVCSR